MSLKDNSDPLNENLRDIFRPDINGEFNKTTECSSVHVTVAGY
jgi:hypothetical protein